MKKTLFLAGWNVDKNVGSVLSPRWRWLCSAGATTFNHLQPLQAHWDWEDDGFTLNGERGKGSSD